MRRASGSTVDVGAISICTGIPVVFWWAFFMESLSGTASAVMDSV